MCARLSVPGASFIVGSFVMPVDIASRKNELVREYLRLSGSAPYRREQEKFAAEGARLCADAAESGLTALSLFVTEEALGKYDRYLRTIRSSSPAEYLISQSVAQCLSDTKNPQGVFCVFAMPKKSTAMPYPPRGGHLLMLESMQDPANLGAVLRTAEAIGIGGVFLTGNCCDAFSPKVLRTSMGAVFRLPIFRCGNAPETVEHLNAAGLTTLAAVPDKSALPVTSLDFSHPTAAVIGNEGNGLTEETKKACTMRVTIPMKGRAESLNAAASAAILMWEMMRGNEGSDRS
jgi:TrmH family RNA methyltransferase